jgi:hypothetical protein
MRPQEQPRFAETRGSMSAPIVLLAAGINRTPVLGRCSPPAQPGTTGPLCYAVGQTLPPGTGSSNHCVPSLVVSAGELAETEGEGWYSPGRRRSVRFGPDFARYEAVGRAIVARLQPRSEPSRRSPLRSVNRPFGSLRPSGTSGRPEFIEGRSLRAFSMDWPAMSPSATLGAS